MNRPDNTQLVLLRGNQCDDEVVKICLVDGLHSFEPLQRFINNGVITDFEVIKNEMYTLYGENFSTVCKSASEIEWVLVGSIDFDPDGDVPSNLWSVKMLDLYDSNSLLAVGFTSATRLYWESVEGLVDISNSGFISTDEMTLELYTIPNTNCLIQVCEQKVIVSKVSFEDGFPECTKCIFLVILAITWSSPNQIMFATNFEEFIVIATGVPSKIVIIKVLTDSYGYPSLN